MNIYSQIRHNKLKTYFIIALFVGLISLVFYLFGQYYGDPSTYFVFGMSFALFSGLTSYFYADKLVLKMSGAKPASKEQYFDYYTVTENLAIGAGGGRGEPPETCRRGGHDGPVGKTGAFGN